MILGRVIGEIHGSIKHRFYEGRKLLWIEKTTPAGAPTGDYLIAVDSVGAGVGEEVFFVRGKEASFCTRASSCLR